MIVIEELCKGFQVWINGEHAGNDTPLLNGFYPWALSKFFGDVQVAGLGPGVGVRYLCNLDAVSSVRVVENNARIIELFSFEHPKLTIVEGDVWTVPHPPCDCVFIDIWGDCNVPFSEVALLESRYAAKLIVSLPVFFDAYLKSLK